MGEKIDYRCKYRQESLDRSRRCRTACHPHIVHARSYYFDSHLDLIVKDNINSPRNSRYSAKYSIQNLSLTTKRNIHFNKNSTDISK